MKKFKIILLGLLLQSSMAYAEISPLEFSIFPPVQFPASEVSIAGARFSLIWGKNANVSGIDLGVIGNVTELNFTGLALSGLFNYNLGEATILGLQASGLANVNVNKSRIYGLQIALGMNLNQAESTLIGLQLAALNISPFETVVGVQAGLFNKALSVTGLQIGLVNSTKVLHGVQVGLANFNTDGPFAIAPILNVGF